MRIARPPIALLACCLGLTAACSDIRGGAQTQREAAPSATVAADPDEVLIGDRSAIEIRVVAAANQRLLPFATPTTLAGFEVLGVESLPTEASLSSSIHRTRVQLRAREIGRFEWPAVEFRLAGPDASVTQVAAGPVALTVRSILPAFPGRAEPFGPRAAPERESPAALAWKPAALGGGALLAAAWLAWALRRRNRRAAQKGAAPAPEPPWTIAIAALDRAAQALRPADAAHAMTAALRTYVARRFGAHSDALTTEELASATPPFAATSRWPGFVALLAELDGLRFAPGSEAVATEPPRLESVRTRAIGFVEMTTPPPELR